jgi:hypothetical protein
LGRFVTYDRNGKKTTRKLFTTVDKIKEGPAILKNAGHVATEESAAQQPDTGNGKHSKIHIFLAGLILW